MTGSCLAFLCLPLTAGDDYETGHGPYSIIFNVSMYIHRLHGSPFPNSLPSFDSWQ